MKLNNFKKKHIMLCYKEIQQQMTNKVIYMVQSVTETERTAVRASCGTFCTFLCWLWCFRYIPPTLCYSGEVLLSRNSADGIVSCIWMRCRWGPPQPGVGFPPTGFLQSSTHTRECTFPHTHLWNVWLVYLCHSPVAPLPIYYHIHIKTHTHT